jgi:hypothetical protein
MSNIQIFYVEPGHTGAGFWYVIIFSCILQFLITYFSFRGDYRNCDLPFWTAKAILQYAAELEDDVSYK